MSRGEFHTSLGARLRRARELRALTQVQVGEALDMAPQTVAAWESGRREPRIDKLAEMASLYGVGVETLFPGAETPAAPSVDLATLERQVRTLRQEAYRLSDRLELVVRHLTADGILQLPEEG